MYCERLFFIVELIYVFCGIYIKPRGNLFRPIGRGIREPCGNLFRPIGRGIRELSDKRMLTASKDCLPQIRAA